MMHDLQKLKNGGKLALAKAISAIEQEHASDKLTPLLNEAVQNASGHVTGLTGPPGVGKSTLTNSMIGYWRNQGKTVGVIAIDPSSKISGGALMGDRTRLTTDPEDDGIFVRSFAARNRLGGLSDATFATMALMRACMDRTIVETVGIGQSETDVTMVADTTLMCVQPGSGDSLQYMKSGLMELPDLVAVTKADLESLACRTRSDVEEALLLSLPKRSEWKVPVELISAKSGENIDSLMGKIESHYDFLKDSGKLKQIRNEKHILWVKDYVLHQYGNKGELQLEKTGFKINLPDSPFANMREIDQMFELVLKENGWSIAQNPDMSQDSHV